MSLPIHEVKEDLLEQFPSSEPWRILVKAPTGSGKSTGVPSILLDSGLEGKIVVVQPRRIAAKMLARRVASLRGAVLGEEVGYVVRFDQRQSAHTRIVFVTDGVMSRWLEENPNLTGIGAVIFDEFHERRLAMDMALADCILLQDKSRNDLKLCVMSATLELEGLESYLSPCRVVEAGGRSFPVEVNHLHTKPIPKGRNVRGTKVEPIWEQCLRVVMEVAQQPDCGNILIFLPGVYEIQRTISVLQNARLSGWEICPLYGTLNPKDQDRAVREGGGSRIIVSTNVAETSLTIPGVRTVIDGGLARIAEFDPNRGMDTLFVRKISRAAAEQRAGRAGRTSPGKCYRLWSEADHARRHEFDDPEIIRVDLTEAVLKLKVRGFRHVGDYGWINPPTDKTVRYAEVLLDGLGAVIQHDVSEIGRQIASLPMHPRMAKLLISAHQQQCLAEGVFVVSVLQGEGIFLRGEGKENFSYASDASDFIADWRGFESAKAMQFDSRRCRAIGVSARSAREVMQSIEQLQRMTQRLGWEVGKVDFENHEKELAKSVLSAYFDQLAVRNSRANFSCRLMGGSSGQLGKDSSVKESELLVATALTEVGSRDVVVYLNGCVAVDENAVKELFPDQLIEHNGAVYDEKIRRVVNRRELRFHDLVIRSKDAGEPDLEQAGVLLAQRVAMGELKLKKWDAGVEQWISRLLCLREWIPELELPGFTEDDRAIALEAVCEGAVSYKQIKDKAVQPALDQWLSAGQHEVLNAYAPERVTLANGKSVKVKYEYGNSPQIALTVQRLYGVKKTPTIANGKVKLQVHICAPNQRPWQMTEDIEGFWLRGFEQMKKDLGGRYPKHDWSGGK